MAPHLCRVSYLLLWFSRDIQPPRLFNEREHCIREMLTTPCPDSPVEHFFLLAPHRMAFRPGNARLYRATNEITKGSAANKSMKLLHSLNCMGIIAHPHEPPSIHFPSFLHDKSSSPILSTTVSSQPHHHTKPAVIKYAKSREKEQRDPNIPTPATMKSPKANWYFLFP